MKSAGCTVIGIASVSAPSSASRRRTSGGKLSPIKRLLRSGNKQEAHELCEQQGISYTSSKVNFSSRNLVKQSNETEGTVSTGDVSTQKQWTDPGDSDSTMSVSAYDMGDDNDSGHQYVFLDWDLADGAGVDCHGPLDGAAISFSEDIYRLRKGVTNTYGNTLVETVPHTHGVHTELQTGRMAPSYDGSGWMDTEIDARDDELGSETNIYGELIHTWDPFCSPSNLGVSWELPGPGAFGVTISGSAQSWKAKEFINHTAKP